MKTSRFEVLAPVEAPDRLALPVDKNPEPATGALPEGGTRGL